MIHTSIDYKDLNENFVDISLHLFVGKRNSTKKSNACCIALLKNALK